jgi:hypothetical protein
MNRREKQKVMRALAIEWSRRAMKQFDCAEVTADPMGKRVMEHGAACYANCAFELLEKIGDAPKESTA